MKTVLMHIFQNGADSDYETFPIWVGIIPVVSVVIGYLVFLAYKRWKKKKGKWRLLDS
jgi:general stress protein CsbA